MNDNKRLATIVPATFRTGDAVYEADELRGWASDIVRMLDKVSTDHRARNREWVIEAVASLRFDAEKALQCADRLYHEVVAFTDEWVEALYAAKDDDTD